MNLHLKVLEGQFSIHRLSPDNEIPRPVFEGHFYSITKSGDELSVVCASSDQITSEKEESGWSCIKVLGPLDFSLTGILADISAVLANMKISLFAVSTFDTDYVLVKSKKLDLAKKALQQEKYVFTE